MDYKNFLSFERMITPVIIKVFFYIGIAASIIAGIVVFFGGIIGGLSDGGFGTVIGGLIGGPVIIVVGVLTARIYSELLILLFQMNETLTDIKYLLEKK